MVFRCVSKLMAFMHIASRVAFGQEVGGNDDVGFMQHQAKSRRHPVIIVGSLLGQTLEVNDHRWLDRCSPWISEWRTAWVSKDMIELGCAVGVATLGQPPQLGLTFDTTTNLTKSPHDIQVRVAKGWDGLTPGGQEIYGSLVARLQAEGWVKDVDVLPMPYDWRLGVADWGREAFPRFQALVESANRKNGNNAVLTGLSMAGPFTQSFLMWAKSSLGASWVEQQIHSFVPVGGPFNGAVNALSAVVGGALLAFSVPESVTDDAKLTFTCPDCNPALPPGARVGDARVQDASTGILASIVKKLELYIEHYLEGDLNSLLRVLPSMYWMSTGVDYTTTPPTDKAYVTLTHGPGNLKEEVTASMMPSLFSRMNEDKAAQLFEYALSVGTTEDPEVKTHCVYSHNVRTFSHLSFPAEGDDSQRSTVELASGDGTVHLDSLSVCDRWKSTVKSYKVPGVPHASMMECRQVHDVIVAVGKEDATTLETWKPPSFAELDIVHGNLTQWAANRVVQS